MAFPIGSKKAFAQGQPRSSRTSLRWMGCRGLLLLLLTAACHCEQTARAPQAKAEREQSSQPHSQPHDETQAPAANQAQPGHEQPAVDERMAALRRELVDTLRERGIKSERVLNALSEVPRHELVPKAVRNSAYQDRPLPIGEDQTISQPYVVALMTELADLDPGDRVLEIGTGSGYQAAILGKLASQVFTIEIVPSLGERARRDLERLGLAKNIKFRIGDGYAGWPEHAPFDAIVVTAAPPKVPEPLKEQLKLGGRLVIPVGEDYQELRVLEKTADGVKERAVIPVRFVPMTGRAQDER